MFSALLVGRQQRADRDTYGQGWILLQGLGLLRLIVVFILTLLVVSMCRSSGAPSVVALRLGANGATNLLLTGKLVGNGSLILYWHHISG